MTAGECRKTDPYLWKTILGFTSDKEEAIRIFTALKQLPYWKISDIEDLLKRG